MTSVYINNEIYLQIKFWIGIYSMISLCKLKQGGKKKQKSVDITKDTRTGEGDWAHSNSALCSETVFKQDKEVTVEQQHPQIMVILCWARE